MKLRVEYLYRYICPFVAGCSVAGATLADETPMSALMVVTSVTLLFASLSFKIRTAEQVE